MKAFKTGNTIAILLVVFTFGLACGQSDENHMDHEDMDHGDMQGMQSENIQIVSMGDYRASFQLMTMSEHNEMMELMDIREMDHNPDAYGHISITVLNEKTGEVVKDADLSVTITDPDGKVETSKVLTMSGGGMFHYGVDLNKTSSGTYTVDSKIKVGGEEYESSVEFNVN